MVINNQVDQSGKFYNEFDNPTIRDFVIPSNPEKMILGQQQGVQNLNSTLNFTKILEVYQQDRKQHNIKFQLSLVDSQPSLTQTAQADFYQDENDKINTSIRNPGILQKQYIVKKFKTNLRMIEDDDVMAKTQVIQCFDYNLIDKKDNFDKNKHQASDSDSSSQNQTWQKKKECTLIDLIRFLECNQGNYKSLNKDNEKVLYIRQNDQKLLKQEKTIQQNVDQVYEYHGLSMNNRQKMVNWMLQVLRVLEVVSTKTFILSVQIMDKYFLRNYELSNRLRKEDIHLIGITSIFMSSKFEDVSHIEIEQLVSKAGHMKFTEQQIITKEVEILRTLGFKLLMASICDDAHSEFSSIVQMFHFSEVEQVIAQQVANLIDFQCSLLQFCSLNPYLDFQFFAKQIVMNAIEITIMINFNKKISDNINEGDQLLNKNKDDLKCLNKFFKILNYFEQDVQLDKLKEEKKERNLKDLIYHLYNDIAIGKINGKHLQKLYPNMFKLEMSQIIKHILDQKIHQ
ncbi:UNKNOWN [Stylonychia lemnae]|uniref:Cyclin-like domain-containing protein n=1 Tax=Stylonychia lemnae TaxID=5949 RepID=A0A078AQ44_STYLE|nr:UNKNOWN [Stylonychia lemnae]|eukprot:CDW84091.1 UNKNOWN [Stylonychia lemnae]